MARIMINIYMAKAKDADEVRLDHHGNARTQVVALKLGEVAVILHDPAVIDAIEAKLTEARALLANAAEKAAA